MAKEDFLFFWGGTFSQWCFSPFEIDGVEYNCCEQYMMAKKAILFQDYESLAKIMGDDDPSYQKAIGKQVKNFDKTKWEKYCRKYVYDANYAKFSQNPDMKAELLKSFGRELVEASPEDRIWGIGLHEHDERSWDKSTWEGTNWLGEEIEKVRVTLKEEDFKQ